MTVPTRYLTSNIRAAALKQDSHIAAVTVVKERKNIAGPFEREKAFSASRTASWPSGTGPTAPNTHPRLTELNRTPHTTVLYRTAHRIGPKAGQAGGLLASVWLCRKSIMACRMVCRSLSGPGHRSKRHHHCDLTARPPHPGPH